MSQHCATFKCSMQQCSMKIGPRPMRSVGKRMALHLGHDGRTARDGLPSSGFISFVGQFSELGWKM